MESDLLEKIYVMQSRINDLELENEHLKKQAESNKRLMEQMQDVIIVKKRVRNVPQHEKDKWSFYKEHKANNEIRDRLSKALELIGYDGKIPWQMIKHETDSIFDRMQRKSLPLI